MTDTAAPAAEAQAAQPQRALARTDQQVAIPLADISVTALAGRDDIERVETIVRVPAAYQYEIKGGHNEGYGEAKHWVEEYSVGLTADGYDYLNRVLGVSFYLPPTVTNENGQAVPNPIHRPDYIYLAMTGVWYNPLGQMQQMTEYVEVDYKLVYMDARINAYGASVIMDPATNLPVFDGMGNPAVKLPPDGELKALKTLSQLRTFGIRYAQTVARVRILKAASGIRSLPIPRVKDIPLKVTGFRDKLTPSERFSQAQDAHQAFWGRPADQKPLTAAELAQVGDQTAQEAAIDRIDRDAIAARQEADTDEATHASTPPGDEPPPPAAPTPEPTKAEAAPATEAPAPPKTPEPPKPPRDDAPPPVEFDQVEAPEQPGLGLARP